MLAKELRELTEEELQLRLHETRRELFNLRQQWYAGSLEDHNRLRAVRKDIARIMTILRERELMTELSPKGVEA
ncbi:MAG TPA: 50S ribosomal protein L29 [Anaerolineae bacterium]|nr:50S ribosomal protein L29 [Anaerolineae bacterium]HQH37569.1 50S ribosomal protein L29 [Anaerolineae bacterium]